jgi:hypothetical protein
MKMKIKKTAVFLVITIMLLGIFGGLFRAFAAEMPLLNENMKTITFAEDTGIYPDAARGFYRMSTSGRTYYNTLMSNRNNDKTTITLLSMELDEFKEGPISAEALSQLEDSLSAARFAGQTVIFRGTYDVVGADEPEPRDINTILGHIEQICPILSRNSDIIYSVQAGMLGAYGEWHSSYYEDPTTGYISADVQKKVVDAFLAGLPSSITVAVRRPTFIRGINGNTMVNAATAFGSSLTARVGLHNDALLSTATDMNTYSDKAYTRQDELDWSNRISRYIPFFGEANFLSEYCEPSTAVQLLDYLNIQGMSPTYHPDVINYFKTTAYRDDTTFDYIAKKLGYRFVLKEAGLNSNTWQGNFLHIKLQFINDGFANLLRATDFYAVLSDGNNTYTAKINDDPRLWDDDSGAITKNFWFSLPSDIPEGEYDVSLKLSSTYSSLKDNPYYNIRFASEGVWNAGTGLNKIGSVSIGKPETPGDLVTGFKQVSRDEASKLNNSSKSYAEESVIANSDENDETDNPDGSFDTIKISDDPDYLYINLKSIDPSVKRQIFLNTDGNNANGYRESRTETGYEWMIENERLYKFTGESGTDDWSWERDRSMMSYAVDDTAEYIINLSLLKLSSPASFTALYQYDDGNTPNVNITYSKGEILSGGNSNLLPEVAVTTAVVTEPEPEVTEPEPEDSVEVSNLPAVYNLFLSGDSLVFSMENVDQSSKHQLFVDSDNNTSTGFLLSHSLKLSGYDYLIENGRVYHYSGADRGTSWSWQKIGDSEISIVSNAIRYTVPSYLFNIESSVTVRTVYRRDDDKTTILKADCFVYKKPLLEEETVTEPPETEPTTTTTPPYTEPTYTEPTTTTTPPETEPLYTEPTYTESATTTETTTTTAPPETEATTTTTPPTPSKPGNNGNGNGNGNNGNGNGKPKK